MKIEFEKNKIELKRIGDIVNFKRGYDLPAYAFVEGEYPVISSSGILGYHNEFKAQGEGLVTGRTGTLGEVYYIQGKYWPHNTALYVTDFKGNYPKYIYFLIKSLSFLKKSDKSTVPGIDRKDLHEYKVPYIAGEQQKQIADALFLIEEKIQLNNKINTELENLAKTIYNYWFVQFDFPYDFEKNEPCTHTPEDKKHNKCHCKPYKSSGGEMVWNEELKREIPKGWEVNLISKYFDYLEGPGITKDKYTDNGHKFINIKCIVDNDLDITEASMIKHDFIEQYSHFLLEENDIVVSTSGTLGRSAIVRKSHLPLLLNTSVIRFRPKNKDEFCFMYSYLKSERFLKTLRKEATGSIQKNFGPTHLDEMKDVFPSHNLIKQYEEKISPIIKKTLLLKDQNTELIKLRDFLLPLLMNGQIKVKN